MEELPEHCHMPVQDPFPIRERERCRSAHGSSSNFTKKTIFVHIIVAICYCLVISAFFRKEPSDCIAHQDRISTSALYSPARESIKYETRVVDLDAGHFAVDNPFVGDPRPELDDAWNSLVKNIHIRVNSNEYDALRPQLNRSSLRLRDGSYIIRLSIYHHLHCLKWVREWIHRGHYWPDLSGARLHERRWHIEHCLESLRMSVMCSAPLAPATFRFEDGKDLTSVRAIGRHLENCVDWESLEGWASKRRVDFSDIDFASVRDG